MNSSPSRPQLDWQVFSDGYTDAAEPIAWPLGSWRRKLRFYATAFLLRHPQQGLILVDTGYSDRFHAATASGLARVHRWLTPVTLTEPTGIAGCLRRQGIQPEAIRHLILTHFHVDHIGGLRDFPDAQVYCSEPAWSELKHLKGFQALRRGFFPTLVPEDLESRMTFIAEGAAPFGDGSLRIYDLPGHAVGQIGVEFTSTTGQEVLLAADACWLSEAYRQLQMPHGVTRLLHDMASYERSLRRLHHLHKERPHLLILPTHCPETAELIVP